MIVDLEQTLQCSIHEPLLPFLEQDIATAKMLSRSFHQTNRNVTPEQIISLFQAAGCLDAQKCVKIAGLIHFISEDEDDAQNELRALVQLSNCIDVPVREHLMRKL